MPIADQIKGFIEDTVSAYVRGATSDGYAEDWDLDQLWQALRGLYPVAATVEDLVRRSGGERNDLDPDYLAAELVADALARYQDREAALGSDIMREIERQVVLNVVDKKWREHLYEMDYLREGIGLRAMAQRDPLVEYQREGYDLFVAMMDAIKEETVGYVFHAEVHINTVEEPPAGADEHAPAAATDHIPADVTLRGVGLGSSAPAQLQYSAPSETGAQTTTYVSDAEVAKFADAGRNDPCPCGSGRKFKKCHGDPTSA